MQSAGHNFPPSLSPSRLSPSLSFSPPSPSLSLPFPLPLPLPFPSLHSPSLHSPSLHSPFLSLSLPLTPLLPTYPAQAPQELMSLFSGSRQVVYGFVPHCKQAALRAKIGSKEVETMVSTSDLGTTKGKVC